MVTSESKQTRDQDSELDEHTEDVFDSDVKLLKANGDVGVRLLFPDKNDVKHSGNDVTASGHETKVPVEAEYGSVPPKRRQTTVPIDRGWAWMVMLGALLEMLIVIGLLKSAGILFIAFQSRFGSSSSMTSLVSTVQQAVYSVTAPFVMTIGVKMLSCRTLLYAGSTITLVAYVITSQADDIRVVMFSHGVLHGLGTAFMQTCSISMVGQYFDKRRGLANGIAVSGGSLGGLIFAPLLTSLLAYYGYSGCFLITGAVAFHCCISGALFRPQEFYTKQPIKKTVKEAVDAEKYHESDEQISRHMLTNIAEVDETDALLKTNSSFHELKYTNVNKREPEIEEHECSMQTDNPSIVITPVEGTIAAPNKDTLGGIEEHTHTKDINEKTDAISNRNSAANRANEFETDTGHIKGMQDADALQSIDPDMENNIKSVSAEHINFLNTETYDDVHDSTFYRPRTMSSPASTQKPSYKRKRLLSSPAVDVSPPSPNTLRKRLQNFRERSNTAHSIGRLVRSLSKSSSELYRSSEFIVGSMFDVPNVSRQIPEETEEEIKEEKMKPFYIRILSNLSKLFDFQLFRRPVFVVYTISAGLLCSSSAMTTVYIAPYAREIGLTNNDVAVILTVYSAVDMCSRIMVGIIADRDWVRRSTLIGIAGLIIGATAQLLRWYVNYEWLMCYAVVLGLVSGVYFSLFAVVIVDYMTVAKLQSCIGFTILSHGAFTSMSFALLGYARDTSGTYVLPFHLIGAMSTLGAVMMTSLPVFQKLEQRKQKLQTEPVIKG